jgi:hypothetical protein
MHFSESIFLNQETVLRERGAVLDVVRLNDILGQSEVYPIMLNDGQTVPMEISQISALAAEITLKIPEKIANNKEFLKQTDLLDFPGARSRENFTLVNIDVDTVLRMYLRGKISYLFNKYSSDFEINNLLFCLKDEKIEVTEIADILFDWIVKNVGEDEEKREQTIGQLPTSPLFVIMTFFNKQLSYDQVNDDKDVSYKWHNRFTRFFEEQITFKYDWHKKWTLIKPHFSNFFMLRDFKYSTDLFETNGKIEVGVKESMTNHMGNLRTSFLQNPFVIRHFDDPEKSWDMAATPQHDGSQLIVEALTPAANNFVKIKKFSNTLNLYRLNLIDDLKKHLVSDSLIEKRNQAFRKATDIEFSLLQLFAQSEFNFTDFLKKLSIKDVQAYNIIHENFVASQRRQEPEHYQIFKRMFPELSQNKTRNENLKCIANKLRFDSIQDAESYLRDKNIDLDAALENRVLTSASKLVDAVIDQWIMNMSMEHFKDYFRLGLDKTSFSELIENLLLTFETLSVRDELIELFEQKTRLIYAPSDTEEYLAAIISEFINDFVSNFGFNFMRFERIDDVLQVASEYQQEISLLQKIGENETREKLLVIYDKADTPDNIPPPLIDNFQLFILKMKLAMLSNCGFAKYNMDANEQLAQLIARLEEMNFSIEQ